MNIADYENKILCGDNIDILKSLPDKFIDCCVTSPPYYGLRDYGTGKWIGGDPTCPHRRLSKASDKTITGHAQDELKGNVGDAIYKQVCPLCGAIREDKQVGLEETPEAYIDRLVGIFREVRRVLKDDGTLWVNIGDSYNSNNYNKNEHNSGTGKQGTNKGSFANEVSRPKITMCKPKDLIGIPWMLALALRNDGWYLRQDIIWEKVNPMPEPVKDRFTKSHEYIFLLSKKSHYFFNQIQETANYDGRKGNLLKLSPKYNNADYLPDNMQNQTMAQGNRPRWSTDADGEFVRNKRDVWAIPTQPVSDAHFATYPEKLVEPCILAGSREGGIVLDPFFGSGTTGRVAVQHGRKFLGIELNPDYVEIAKKRVSNNYTWLV